MKQVLVTVSAGKRLIAKAILLDSAVKRALRVGIVVIVAGTTNGYVAEEILMALGVSEGFSRRRFFRGVTIPPNYESVTSEGRLPDESQFPGDIVISKGTWLKGKTIFDVVADLKEGDVILKGANALDLTKKTAGILIGHPNAGTIGVALQATVGRRVKLILPVGLEKRVCGDIFDIAERVNEVGGTGFRLLPVPGQIFTEIEAINLLTGAKAELIASGGVCGAEGSCWLAIYGSDEQEQDAEKIIDAINNEKPFIL